MIRNTSVLSALFFLAEKTEDWIWFHALFRRAAIHVFTPVIQKAVLRDLRCELICRNSVLTASSYNVFRSDIDYTVLFETEPSAATVRKLKTRMERLRRFFPFVGETEVYLRDEWTRKVQLAGPVLRLVQFLRKIAWQTQAIRHSQDPYHRRKAERALMRMIDMRTLKYSPVLVQNCARQQVREFLREYPSVNWSHQVSAYSHFLGWTFGTSLVSEASPYLHLTSAECLLLAALTPGGHHALAEEVALIHKLRTIPKIRTAYNEACEAEYLLCRSVKRMSANTDAVMDDWLRELSGSAGLTLMETGP
jgi:hypothetical protein